MSTKEYWIGYVDAMRDLMMLVEEKAPELERDIAPLVAEISGDRLGCEDLTVEDDYDE